MRRSDDLLVEIGGPDVVDWNEFGDVELKAALGTAHRAGVHVRSGSCAPQAAIMERLHRLRVTRDQLRMLQLGDNVVSDGGREHGDLGLDGTLCVARADASFDARRRAAG